jgi:hypothetical protein
MADGDARDYDPAVQVLEAWRATGGLPALAHAHAHAHALAATGA